MLNLTRLSFCYIYVLYYEAGIRSDRTEQVSLMFMLKYFHSIRPYIICCRFFIDTLLLFNRSNVINYSQANQKRMIKLMKYGVYLFWFKKKLNTFECCNGCLDRFQNDFSTTWHVSGNTEIIFHFIVDFSRLIEDTPVKAIL